MEPGASGSYASDDMTPEEEKAALHEALELFNQSTMLSSLQVQSELERTFSSMSPAADQAQQERVCSPPEVLLSFWVEQGLSATAAGRMVEEIVSSGRCYTTEQLSNKMERLQSVLPDADIASLALKDLALLDCDMSTALVNMICLVEAFPGKDIMSLLVRQPKLLWVTDMRQRIPRIFGKLQQLHPSHDHSVVRDIIAEYPELLFRMDYYMDAPMLDYLPIEIQNMFVLTGQGLSFLYRYYNNKRTNYAAEVDGSRTNFD